MEKLSFTFNELRVIYHAINLYYNEMVFDRDVEGMPFGDEDIPSCLAIISKIDKIEVYNG